MPQLVGRHTVSKDMKWGEVSKYGRITWVAERNQPGSHNDHTWGGASSLHVMGWVKAETKSYAHKSKFMLK